MNPPGSSHQRLHDLDALRAAAMLLGIFYHAALSFAVGFPWMVQDSSQTEGIFVFQSWVHGFRMQLFMLVSGFFTAMLWRQKGLKALLWHRCRRVVFPCLLGLVTVVPAVIGASILASKYAPFGNQRTALAEPASANLWAAIRAGDGTALQVHLRQPGSLTNQHPLFGVTPLTWAALTGQGDLVVMLLDQGARIGAPNRDGGTALHAAAFMGNAGMVDLLIQRGADVNAASLSGEVPLQSAMQPFTTVEYIAGLLVIPVDRQKVEEGRQRMIQQLRSSGAREGANGAGPGSLMAAYRWLTETSVFGVIWFLWFLVWLVGIFAVYALVADRLGWKRRPLRFVLSPARLLWLVPLTVVPTALMDFRLGIGPDTSMGILPMPHVLSYYGLFFFFGVFYYDCDDREGCLGRSWRWSLPITCLILFPLAEEFATGIFGFRDALLPARFHRPAAVFFQSIFAWTMSFASIGLFRALLTRENPTIRYLSDSSYWLYLAHLPPCIAGQALISRWPAPAWVKLPLFSMVLTAFLLLTYQFLVRHTWLGKLLNGPRSKPVRQPDHAPRP